MNPVSSLLCSQFLNNFDVIKTYAVLSLKNKQTGNPLELSLEQYLSIVT